MSWCRGRFCAQTAASSKKPAFSCRDRRKIALRAHSPQHCATQAALRPQGCGADRSLPGLMRSLFCAVPGGQGQEVRCLVVRPAGVIIRKSHPRLLVMGANQAVSTNTNSASSSAVISMTGSAENAMPSLASISVPFTTTRPCDGTK